MSESDNNRTIRGFSLTQPWASLVAVGAKKIETRSWGSRYRGLVAIHAAKGMPREAQEFCREDRAVAGVLRQTLGIDPVQARVHLPLGVILAVAELCDCRSMAHSTGVGLAQWVWDLPLEERTFGNYAPERYGFFLRNVMRIPEPIPCRGALGLWQIPADVLARIEGSVPEPGGVAEASADPVTPAFSQGVLFP